MWKGGVGGGGRGWIGVLGGGTTKSLLGFLFCFFPLEKPQGV